MPRAEGEWWCFLGGACMRLSLCCMHEHVRDYKSMPPPHDTTSAHCVLTHHQLGIFTIMHVCTRHSKVTLGRISRALATDGLAPSQTGGAASVCQVLESCWRPEMKRKNEVVCKPKPENRYRTPTKERPVKFIDHNTDFTSEQ